MVDINTEWSSGRMNGQEEQRMVNRNNERLRETMDFRIGSAICWRCKVYLMRRYLVFTV